MPAKPYTRQPDGLRLDFRGINIYRPIDQLPEGKYPMAVNVRRYLEQAVRGRAKQGIEAFLDGGGHAIPIATPVHTIRRLNDSTPAGPASGFVLISGGGTNLYANAVVVDSGLSGNPVSMVPFRPNASVQPWMYVADSNKMSKVRSDGTKYKIGIKEAQNAPAVSANLGNNIRIMGNVSAWVWGDSPHSGPVALYIWKNPNDHSGWGPTRTIADSKVFTTGNTLSFDPGGSSGASPVAWGVSDGVTITGTKSMFQPALESQGYQDFNAAITCNIFVPAAGTHTFRLIYKDNVLWGIGGGASFPAVTGGAAQTMTVVSGLPLMIAPTIGGGGGITGDSSVVVTFPAAGIYPFEIDWDYWFHSGRTLVMTIDGSTVLPITTDVLVNAQYRTVGRSSFTGALSNPSPATVASALPAQSVVLTPDYYSDLQVDLVDYYRKDQAILDYTYVGTGPNTNPVTQFTDSLTDAVIQASNNPLIQFDNFEPFPSIDLPRSGVVNVSNNVATWVSGDLFNVRWLPGTIIVVGTVAYTFVRRPSSTTAFTLEGLVDGTNLPYKIAEPFLAAQPLPAMWGPTDNVLFMFACGDKLRPGTLYWTKGNNPDSAPQTNQQDVTSPSEPLMNGAIVGGIGFVMSTERGFLIYPNFFNALATVSGTAGSTWTIQESIADRGLYIRNCIATDGGKTVFFRGKDGVYRSPGGTGSESISDADLYPLFPHEGFKPHSVTMAGVTLVPPDDTLPFQQKFSCANGFLYYDYTGLDGNPHTLVYDIVAKGWVIDTYQHPVTIHALEEGANVNDTITGCTDGNLRRLSDVGLEIQNAIILTQAVNAGDARGNKRIGDIFIRAIVDSASALSVTPYTGRFRNVVSNVAPGTLSGVNTSVGYIVNFTQGGGQEADDIELLLSWPL
jgi:hypothetical protein